MGLQFPFETITLNLARSGFLDTRVTVGACLLFLVSALIAPAGAQYAIDYVVGTTGAPPNIDGHWGSNEWNTAIEIVVNKTSSPTIRAAYLRLEHDDKWLYFIYDAPFDNVAGPFTSKNTPWIWFTFDGNADGYLKTDPNDLIVVARTYGNGTVTFAFLLGDFDGYLYNARSQISVTENLGTSPNSNVNHRIWEGRVPLGPLTLNSPKMPDGSPVIGFYTIVDDSAGHSVSLLPPSSKDPATVVRLKIAPHPVPENIEPLIPLSIAIFVVGFYSHRKVRGH
jgi:hypothetical protein